MCNNFVISAVICELNPPHKGHISIIEQCKAKTGGYCIAVMSGNYVQRGQPAVPAASAAIQECGKRLCKNGA